MGRIPKHQRSRRDQTPPFGWTDLEAQALFESSVFGLGTGDPSTGRILRVNDRFCEITGYSRDELLGTSGIQLTHPDDRAEDSARITRMLDGETDEYNAEKRYVRKDGRVIWVLLAARAIRDRHGTPLKTV